MRVAIIVGVILIVIGVASLVYGGITYKEKETIVKFGPVEVTAEEKRKFPISEVAAGAMVAGGVVLLVLGLSRR